MTTYCYLRPEIRAHLGLPNSNVSHLVPVEVIIAGAFTGYVQVRIQGVWFNVPTHDTFTEDTMAEATNTPLSRLFKDLLGRPAAVDATIDGQPYAKVDEVKPSLFGPDRVRVLVQGVWSTVPTASLVPVIPLTPAAPPIPWDEDGWYGDAWKVEDEDGIRVRLPGGHLFFDPGTATADVDDRVRETVVWHYKHDRERIEQQLKLWE